jgi:predicted metal-dependent phosphoesterase TrpH
MARNGANTGSRILADFHCHSQSSSDSDMSPDKLIAAAQQRGLDCLALTDHNTMESVKYVQQHAPFRVIPGEEIKTPYGEIIGLYLREEIPAYLSPQETCQRIKEQGGLVVIPHPFDLTRPSHLGEPWLESVLPYIDALEVYNARVIFPWHNAKARAYAVAHNLPATAGSDAHMPIEVGQVRVEMPPFQGRDDLLQALRQGRILGRISSPLVHVYTAYTKRVTKRGAQKKRPPQP